MIKEQWKVVDGVFSLSTVNALKKLAAKHCFSYLKSMISEGKESRVFSALRDGFKAAVKLYLIETCNFNSMRSYLTLDPRFWRLPSNKRGLVFRWVEREFRNLLRAWEFHVSVPKPICFYQNVLVMDFIRHNQSVNIQAPLLKDVMLSKTVAKRFFRLLRQELIKLLKAGLVHGDLSEYNIMVFDNKPVLIDLSHATIAKNPEFKDLWIRDLEKINNYFLKFGLSLNFDELSEASKNL